MKISGVFSVVLALVGMGACSSDETDCSVTFNDEYVTPSNDQEGCTAWGDKYGCGSAQFLTSGCDNGAQCCRVGDCSSTPVCEQQ